MSVDFLVSTDTKNSKLKTQNSKLKIMGFLIKFILVVILIIWLLGKVAKLFLKAFLNSQMQNMANQQKAQQQPKYPEGSIHVDVVPDESKTKKNKDSLGGEYVDYEVVK